MRILRIAIVPALVSVLIGVLTGCGHRGSMHALPPTAGAGNGNVLGAVRKPRTINEAAYPNAVIADTPLAFYRLNDAGSTMSDSGANGLNGSYGTSVGHNAGSLVPNTIDPAAAFPGGAWSANAIGTVAHSTTLQPANIALEAWVSEKSVNSGGYVDLVSYGPQSAGQAYSLQLSPTNTISGFVAVTNSPGYSQFTGSTVLTPGTAYHVVLAYDGTAPKLYVNGKLETGTADGATSGGALGYGGVGTTYGLSIGGGQSTTRTIFNGTIDDVAVYGSALTATKVAAHYAAAQVSPDDPYALNVMSDTPVAYYRLDDAGSAMYDATNNRLNGAYGTGITKRTTSLVSNTADPSASFPGGTWSANSIATVPPNALLKPNAVSVEGWVKETAANSGGILDLVSFGPESGAGYALQISATNTLAFTVRTTGTPATVTVSGSTVLTAGTVYHVVATFDGETAKLYLNGTVDGSSVGTGNVNYAGTGTYGLAIGATQSTSRMVFNGTLDEVAVYDHALNASRVSSHYGVSAFSASQTGPAHILTWAYYDNAHNTGVSVQYMLRHVDWVEASEPYPTTPDRVNAFRAAGGMHSAWYADPGISYHCNSPFGPTSLNTPGSCSPAITGYVSESDWLHGTSAPNYAGAGETPRPGFTPSPTGARMHTETSTSVLYGERMNPGSSEARTAFGTYTTNLVSASGRLDVVLMDDSSPHYRTEEFNFEFGTTPSEYAGTGGPAAWNNDVRALACAAARPVVFNGASFDPNDSTTASDDGAMYRSPCVAGAMIEGAFVGSPPRSSLNVGASWNTFLAKADKALLAQSYGKLALILNEQSCAYGTSCFDPTGDRVYGLAGIWLVYDPRFTVAWSLLSGTDPNMADGDGNPDSLVAEFGIVPTQPYTSAGLDVKALQVTNGHTASGGPAGGPFVREFTQCYQDGASIGACAVVMNAEDTTYTSGGVVNMPSLAHGPYAHALVLNDAPADNGGSATWTGTVPTTLQPTTAVILKKT